MTSRICPHCGKEAYSAAESEPIWECPYCGKNIPRGLGRTLKEIMDDFYRGRLWEWVNYIFGALPILQSNLLGF